LEVLEFATKDDNIAKNILHQIFDIVKCKHGAEQVNKTDYVIMLTDQIQREYTFKTMKVTGEMYYYDDIRGLYVKGGE
jgi:hypothetical protein